MKSKLLEMVYKSLLSKFQFSCLASLLITTPLAGYILVLSNYSEMPYSAMLSHAFMLLYMLFYLRQVLLFFTW